MTNTTTDLDLPEPGGLPIMPSAVGGDYVAVWVLDLPIAQGVITRAGDTVYVAYVHSPDRVPFESSMSRISALQFGEMLHSAAEELAPGPKVSALLDLAVVFVSAARWGSLLPGHVSPAMMHTGMIVRPFGMSQHPGWVRIVHIEAPDHRGCRYATVRRVDDPGPPYPMHFHDYPGGYEVRT